MHILEARIGDLIRIGQDITFTVLDVSARGITFAFHAPEGVIVTPCSTDAVAPEFDFHLPPQ